LCFISVGVVVATNDECVEHLVSCARDTVEYGIHALSLTCGKCGAMLFEGESTSKGNAFSFCCAHCLINLPVMERPPPPLDEFLIADTTHARHFRSHIREFNNVVSMASSAANVFDSIPNGVQSFTIYGWVHHRMGRLLSDIGASINNLSPYSAISTQPTEIYVET